MFRPSTCPGNRNRYICNEDALVCVLQPPAARMQKPKWQLRSAGNKLRPLPDFVSHAPRRLSELFPDIHEFAAKHELVLCTHVESSLVADAMSWSGGELKDLFSCLRPEVFSHPTRMRSLEEFVSLIASATPDLIASVTPCVVAALRSALLGTARLGADHIASVLRHLRDADVRILPGEPPSRRILRVLAESDSQVLIVPESYMPDGSRQVHKEDLTALLKALEPEVHGPDSDAASRTAFTLIRGHGNTSSIVGDPAVASLDLLRGHDVRSDDTIALSIQTIRDLVARDMLFAKSPEANMALPIVLNALPDFAPVTLDQRISRFLKDTAIRGLVPGNVDKSALSQAVRRATSYGPPSARRLLIEHLDRVRGPDDRRALRCLCAGAREAADSNRTLYSIEHGLGGLERILKALLETDPAAFLVPSEITMALPRTQRRQLGVTAIGVEYFDRVSRNEELLTALKACQLTEDERALLLCQVKDDRTLRRLPVFGRTDGTIGPATEMFRETDQWSAPRSLRSHVLLLEPSRRPETRRREEMTVREWIPTEQVVVALKTPDAHRYRREILDALAEIGNPGASSGIPFRALRESRWLIARSQPVAPVAVLDLPDEVAHEARSLERRGAIPSFVSRQDLSGDVRDRAGFSVLQPEVLPCRSESLARLGSLLEESPLIGRLGSAARYPLAVFRTLAERRADLALPGWPLLAAVLRSVDHDADGLRIIGAFDGVEEQHLDLAIDYLNALAAASQTSPDHAVSAFHHACYALTRWSARSRRTLFSRTRVPTRAGDWRHGHEVVPTGEGLAPGFVMESNSAAILGFTKRTSRHVGDARSSDRQPRPTHMLGGWERRPISTTRYKTLHDIDVVTLRHQRDFLDRWTGRIPARLIVVYLALLGTHDSLGSLAKGTAASQEIALWWDEVRQKLGLTREHRLLFDIYRGHTIHAISLSGDDVEVPPATGSHVLLRGNGHKTGTIHVDENGEERRVSTLRIRAEDITSLAGDSDPVSGFRRFVETLAGDCLSLWKADDTQALNRLLDQAIMVNQTKLRETQALLQDELHSTLSGLKPEIDSVVWNALNDFRGLRDRATALGKSEGDIASLKTALWNAVDKPEAHVDLLGAVRGKIEAYGYSPDRILFELLQNADDAYLQLDNRGNVSCFVLRVRSGEYSGFQTVHWGRPINDFGNDSDEGHRRGYGRDLYNMLLMNFSEKHQRDRVTGHFGLGFKTVHLLSDSVGIASGFLALRTRGGLIPEQWPQGAGASARERREGQWATIVDVPFAAGKERMGRDAVQAFRKSMIWSSLFGSSLFQVGRLKVSLPQTR